MMKLSFRNHVALVAFLALAAFAHATAVDLTTAGSQGTINGAIFSQQSLQSAGTGVIDPFVRLQVKGIEQGYNTDGALEFDTKAGLWTHSITLGAIPIVTINNVKYREFLLDINETD